MRFLNWETIGTILCGICIIAVALFKIIFKLKNILKTDKHYTDKSYKELINCDIATQFNNFQYIIKFHNLKGKKKMAFEITCKELCAKYSDSINKIIYTIKHNDKINVEEYCNLQYHSSMIFNAIDYTKGELIENLDNEYFLKFYNIVETFAMPFTEGLLEEIEKTISKFHFNHGHNYNRLLLNTLELHFAFVKLFLKYLHVNCVILNGSLN